MPSSPKRLRELKSKRQEEAGHKRMAKHYATVELWSAEGAAAKRQGKRLGANPYTAKRDAKKAFYWNYGWTITEP
jgi:hypothetical protein